MRSLLIAFACLAAAVAVFFLWNPDSDGSGLEGRGLDGSVVREDEPLSSLDAVDAAHEASRAEASAQPTVMEAPPSAPRAATAEAVEPARILGRVTDAEGRGLAAGDVLARRTRTLFDRDAAEEPTGVETDGSFVLEIEPGGVVLVAGADGYAPLERSVEVRAGETLDVGELRLAPGVTLAGRVVDEAGRAVEDARVRTSRQRTAGFMAGLTGDGGSVRTDADGRFTVARQAPGPYSFRVSHRAYPNGQFSGRTERAGERVDGIEVVLRVGGEISGTVAGYDALTPEEREGLRVAVARDGERSTDPFDRPRRVPVGEDATFVVRGLEVGTAYTLQLETREAYYDPRGRRSLPVLANTGDRGVVVEWDAGANLRFRLADPSGQPIAGARIGLDTAWSTAPSVAEEPEPGLYVLDHLWPTDEGGPRIDALVPGYEPWELDRVPFSGTADIDLGTITLQPRPSLTVTVLDRATGDPVEGARVGVEVVPDAPAPNGDVVMSSFSLSIGEDGPLQAPSETVETDAEGRAILDVTPGDRVHVDVAHPDHAGARFGPFTLDRNRTSFEETVRLDPGGAVRVLLRDDLGQPVPERNVVRRGVLGRAAKDRFVSDAQGEALFRGLAPGTHGFRVGDRVKDRAMTFSVGMLGGTAPEYEWTEVEVLPGETIELVLDAPRPTSVHGRITEGGTPLAGARVSFERAQGPGDFPLLGLDGGPSTTTDARGAYVLDGLDPGEGELMVSHPRRSMPTKETIELDPGTNDIEIDLDLAVVTGVVLDASGEPLAGARVRAREHAPTRQRTTFAVMVVGDGEPLSFGSEDVGAEPVTTDENGRYELRGVTSGVELVVVATAENGETVDSEPFEVQRDGRRDGVDLRFEPAGALTVELEGNTEAATVLLSRGSESPRMEQMTGDVETFDDLTPGTYSVSVLQLPPAPGAPEPPAWTPRNVEVEVRVGETATAHFERE